MVKRIEDAQYAIYANSATGVKVLSNTFERNWVVARLVQKTANPAAPHVFRGNLFFDNVLKPPFSGQAPLPGTHLFAGIWASSIPYVWLGDGSNSPNTALNRFVDLRIGIISNKSVFSVNRTSFETIIDAGIVEGYQTGIGILAEASSYIVYAISPKDHYIRIYNNRFDNTNTGILTINAVYTERSATGDDKINDNYIYSSTISGASLIALNAHGPSVFIAQSMLPACRWQEYHELSLLACETAAIQIPSVAIEESISYPPSMSLYPNPTSNLVRVDINELEPSAVPGELVLKNAYGQIVLRQSIHENIIDLQQLPSGMYILEWWSGNHRISTEKLIKS